ncbi:MAG: hypothetical protein KA821_17995 [Chitinophagaceae bacterium]|nr:hypothetical protein [Chitinophagaceae bacterium]
MHKYFLITAYLFITLPVWAKPEPCFKNKRTILKAVNQSKITDDVILLKRKGYFKSYTSLLGLRMNKLTGTYTLKEDSIFLNICMKRNSTVSYAKGIISNGKLNLLFPEKAEEKSYFLYDSKQMKELRRKPKEKACPAND